MNDIIASHQSEKYWVELVSFRHLRQIDLPALEWDGEYAHLRRVYAHAFEMTRTGKNCIWVADLPGTGIIGQIFIQLHSVRFDLADGVDRAYLFAFRIKSHFRNAGLGGRFLQHIENDLIKRGYREITLIVARDNQSAIRFYKLHGFQILAAEPGEWSFIDQKNNVHNVIEPAWRMAKFIYGET